MRFLRNIKARCGNAAVAAKVGASAEEEEEGRQGLLPHTPTSTCNQYNIELTNNNNMIIQLPALQQSLHHVNHAPSPTLMSNKQQEQEACTTQVVTLKAFIHCQGCARRVKKALSKLQGVNTYHVDMDLQKVTVIGSLCAEEVLQSVNKVIKGTQLWASPNNKPTSPNTAVS